MTGLPLFRSSPRASAAIATVAAASTLVAGNATAQGGATRLLSAPSVTVQGNNHSGRPPISADGTLVSFLSPASNLVAPDTGGFQVVFVRDLTTGELTRESVSLSGAGASGICIDQDLSGDGLCVSFLAVASNLVPGHVPIGLDLFVRDRVTGTTTIESYGLGGASSTHCLLARIDR